MVTVVTHVTQFTGVTPPKHNIIAWHSIVYNTTYSLALWHIIELYYLLLWLPHSVTYIAIVFCAFSRVLRYHCVLCVVLESVHAMHLDFVCDHRESVFQETWKAESYAFGEYCCSGY